MNSGITFTFLELFVVILEKPFWNDAVPLFTKLTFNFKFSFDDNL